ncbi:DsbA family protein [Salipiger sp. 1_MG-2023]|uniref:DsbA family protein n=1 Tax=Salipiger sp. 1_MG-2023 TaxID=3062665 RepID=UPI0026E436A0|nr:DsbA family protein [Salipiger sp. 1_MG-2023]MDO6587175.1 DsbA family protein [Salipiger sp. 1_MG-2023]
MSLTRRKLLVIAGAAGLSAGAPALAQGLTEDAVLRDPDAPVLGNPSGDVTIVEWFDYQCPFCKQMHPDLMSFVAADSGIRLVMKDWPIFGATSQRAAQLALGAHDLGAYLPVMESLMRTVGRLSDGAVDRSVGRILPPKDALRAYRKRRATWDALLERNSFQAAGLGFRGTPGFTVETVIFDGALDKAALRKAVAGVRGG